MHFLRRLSPFLHHHRHHHHLLQRRHFYDPSATAGTRFVRDSGLDHAVIRERDLKPLVNLKNFIKAEPSKSLPLSLITDSKISLHLPTRPIEFIRRYPFVFQEYLPGNLDVLPHIKLTKEALELDAEERLVYESVQYRNDLADRVLKLLMILRPSRIKLSALGKLRWELGLPENFVELIVPEFPDYFMVKKGVGGGDDDDVLELVCWTEELAVSAIQMVWLANKGVSQKRVSVKKRDGEKKEKEEKVQPFCFPLKYSSEFKMDKEYKGWVDEWQKLPYVSPYEGETEKVTMSDEFDKYAVGVLHEVLNLFVGKKGDKEIVLKIGEHLGLRGRFRKALLQHPGIFYVSSKNRMYTVVLRDGYKRGTLIKENPLMEVRFKYLDLMHTKKKKGDEATELKKKDAKPKKKDKGEDQENDGSDESDEEDDEEVSEVSNEDSDRDSESEEDDEQGDYYDDNVNKKISRGVGRSSARAVSSESRGKRSPRSNREIDYKGENLYPRSNRNNDFKGRDASPRFNGKGGYQAENSSPRSYRKDGYKDGNSYARSWGAERENNMSGERQFNRPRRGDSRENSMSGERQFNRPRRGNERENSMSGERQFNRPRRGNERENSMSGERQFNKPRRGNERENSMSGERQFNRPRRGSERENMSGERSFNRQRRGAERENNTSGGEIQPSTTQA